MSTSAVNALELPAEPDADIGQPLLRLLGEVYRLGTTVLIATHDPLIAARCDTVIRILDGRIIDQVDVTPAEDPQALLERITRFAH